MSTIFFILMHLFILFVIVFCWKADSGGRIVFTPFVIFVAIEIFFSWSTWLLFFDTDVRLSGKAIVTPLLATLCFCLGFLLTSKYIRDVCDYPSSAWQLTEFLKRPLIVTRQVSSYFVVFSALILIGFGCGIYYYQGYPPTMQAIAKIAVERELTEEVQTELHDIVVLGRRELTKGHVFSGAYRGQGVFRSFMVTAWTYGMLLASILTVAGRKRKWAVIAMLFFVGSFYFIAGTGERSRFAWSVLLVLFSLSFVTRINVRKLMIASLILSCFLMMMTLFLRRYQPVEAEGELAKNVAVAIVNRIVSGNKISNVRIMNLLDDRLLSHTFGRNHLREFLNILPGVHRPPLGHEVGEIIRPGKTTYFNGTYLSIVYIDFGLAGIVLVYFIIGVFLRTGFYFLLKISKEPISIVFMSLAVYNLGKMGIDSGIVSFLVGMVPVVGIHSVILLIVRGMAPKRIPAWETIP